MGEPDEGIHASSEARPSRSSSDRQDVVTIAALYGAGGSVIGARLAEQLAVPFFDRAIVQEVAQRTGLPERAVGEVDEQPRSFAQRLFARMGRASTIAGGHMERLDSDLRDLRVQVEEVLAGVSASGGVVIGRGGMVVLRTVPSALHALPRTRRLLRPAPAAPARPAEGRRSSRGCHRKRERRSRSWPPDRRWRRGPRSSGRRGWRDVR